MDEERPPDPVAANASGYRAVVRVKVEKNPVQVEQRRAQLDVLQTWAKMFSGMKEASEKLTNACGELFQVTYAHPQYGDMTAEPTVRASCVWPARAPHCSSTTSRRASRTHFQVCATGCPFDVCLLSVI